MTDDELRAEVNALIASGENGEGLAIENDYLWTAFDGWWETAGSGFLSQTFSQQTVQKLMAQLSAAFEAGWSAYAAFHKAG